MDDEQLTELRARIDHYALDPHNRARRGAGGRGLRARRRAVGPEPA
jgi:hypothetical protein